jgi:hypothetical protein
MVLYILGGGCGDSGYDDVFTRSRSCLNCYQRDRHQSHCAWRDCERDLSPSGTVLYGCHSCHSGLTRAPRNHIPLFTRYEASWLCPLPPPATTCHQPFITCVADCVQASLRSLWNWTSWLAIIAPRFSSRVAYGKGHEQDNKGALSSRLPP